MNLKSADLIYCQTVLLPVPQCQTYQLMYFSTILSTIYLKYGLLLRLNYGLIWSEPIKATYNFPTKKLGYFLIAQLLLSIHYYFMSQFMTLYKLLH